MPYPAADCVVRQPTAPAVAGSSTESCCPARRSSRYESLDLWRGVACLLVVLQHSTIYADYWLPSERPGLRSPADWCVAATARMWIGVPLFFVISGYCIAASADTNRRKGYRLTDYFARRFRRIFPPYWLSLVFLFAWVAGVEWWLWPGLLTDRQFAIPLPSCLGFWEWAGNLTLTEMWRPLIHGPPMQVFHGVMWTLCYEEQFYAVVGLLLLMSRRHFFAGVAAVTVLAVVARKAVWHFGGQVDGFFFDGYWHCFAAGVLVYWTLNYTGQRGRLTASAFLGASLAWTVWRAGLPRGVHCCVTGAMALSLAFALLLLWLHRWDASLVQSRLLRPLSWCGGMCYSLYLVHWPVCKTVSHGLYLAGVRGNGPVLLVTVPTCLLLSLAVATPFHLWVERRFLRARHKAPSCPVPGTRSSRPTPRPVLALCGAYPSEGAGE